MAVVLPDAAGQSLLVGLHEGVGGVGHVEALQLRHVQQALQLIPDTHHNVTAKAFRQTG